MNRRSRGFLIDVLRQCDYILLGLCLVCSAFGLVMIASATRYMSSMRYVAVQAAATALGVILYILMSSVDLPEMTKKGWKWILLANFVLILLLRTPFGAADDTGNRAWLKFPFLPVMVQPAELVKIGYILLLAKQLDWLKKEKNDLKSLKSMAFLGGHFLILFGLYYVISSDMGSDLVLLFIFLCMCFVGGVALRWFLLGLSGGAAAFYLLWQEDKIPEYMKKRFIVLFDHSYDTLDTGWHQTRSLLTLGGGKLTGQGLFHGTQTQSAFSASLPARHTDFIFAVIGEELGMLGCLLVLVLLSAVIIRCIYVAVKAATPMETLVCVGVASMLLFQMIANVGMCLFVMPVIGLTLPFFSYGGSSVVALYAAVGLVSSVHSHSLPEWLR